MVILMNYPTLKWRFLAKGLIKQILNLLGWDSLVISKRIWPWLRSATGSLLKSNRITSMGRLRVGDYIAQNWLHQYIYILSQMSFLQCDVDWTLWRGGRVCVLSPWTWVDFYGVSTKSAAEVTSQDLGGEVIKKIGFLRGSFWRGGSLDPWAATSEVWPPPLSHHAG